MAHPKRLRRDVEKRIFDPRLKHPGEMPIRNRILQIAEIRRPADWPTERVFFMRATKRKRESAAAAAPRKVAAGVMAGKPPAAKKQGPTVVLAGNCSVKDAAALKESLCAKFDESAAVTVDVRELERVDTATIQLLCAFVRDRAAQDRQVVWMGESRPLQDAARLLGVGELLALPRVAESNGSGVTA